MEAVDFTPWLRQHADLLAKALSLDIEILDTEVSVGPFSADLGACPLNELVAR